MLTQIDFGKVDLTSTNSNMAGLVFVPEDDNAPVATRTDLGYTAEQAKAVNDQINVEYTASYAYHAIWAYFARDYVALPGFAKFFGEQSEEEREHAEEFMIFQNKRGGKVDFEPLAVPRLTFMEDSGMSDALYAMELHLQLEKFVYFKLKALHKVADEADDPQMMDFVEDYLGHQVDAIKTAGDYIAQLKRVGTLHGLYHFDRVLLDGGQGGK